MSNYEWYYERTNKKKIKDLQAELDIQEAKLNFINNYKGFIPELLHAYYYIGDDAEIRESYWSNHRIDEYRLLNNNIFSSSELAQHALDNFLKGLCK